jgi:hypothetical protein
MPGKALSLLRRALAEQAPSASSKLPEQPVPDSRARHTSGRTRLPWFRIVASVLDFIGSRAPGTGRKLVQGKGKSRLWEAAPRRQRLGCRRLRGCLRGKVAQIGVRGGATGPPDDGQDEAAHLAPHLLTRTGFHRTRLLLRGGPVARPFAGCDELGSTSTEFLGLPGLSGSIPAHIPYRTRFSVNVGRSQTPGKVPATAQS